jgi:hypothetical protein
MNARLKYEPSEMPPGFGLRRQSAATAALWAGTGIAKAAEGRRTPGRYCEEAGSFRFMVPMCLARYNPPGLLR